MIIRSALTIFCAAIIFFCAIKFFSTRSEFRRVYMILDLASSFALNSHTQNVMKQQKGESKVATRRLDWKRIKTECQQKKKQTGIKKKERWKILWIFNQQTTNSQSKKSCLCGNEMASCDAEVEQENEKYNKWKRAKLNKNYDIQSIKINYVIFTVEKSPSLAYMKLTSAQRAFRSENEWTEKMLR